LVIKAQVFAQSERVATAIAGLARRHHFHGAHSRDVIINYLSPPSPRPCHQVYLRAPHTHYPHPCRAGIISPANLNTLSHTHYICVHVRGRSQTATSERVFMHACMRCANKHTPAASGLRVKFNIVRNVCIVGIPNGLLMAVTSTSLVKRDLNGAIALTWR
jgi:hypothetical protein